jgi:hypothetical protein
MSPIVTSWQDVTSAAEAATVIEPVIDAVRAASVANSLIRVVIAAALLDNELTLATIVSAVADVARISNWTTADPEVTPTMDTWFI